MHENFLKKVKVTDDDLILNYSFDKMENKKTIISLIDAMLQENIEIKNISVRDISDYDEGTNIYEFETLADYLGAFDRLIFDKSIQQINILCNYNNVNFNVAINPMLNRLHIRFFNYKNEVNFDGIIRKTIGKQK